MSRYNLRSHGEVPPNEIELDNNDDDSTDADDVSESDAIEDDPFYEPYLENETLMNIGRIVRYELARNDEDLVVGEYEYDESEPEDEAPVNTRVVPESESLPPPPPVPVVSEPEQQQQQPLDPSLLGPNDFEGLPRYRLAFMCVRYFEFTGIRNIAVASSIPNEQLVRALCQIPRGRVVPDCSICSYPLWDGLQTKCCGQSLCIHCVNRCAECPYCRAAEY